MIKGSQPYIHVCPPSVVTFSGDPITLAFTVVLNESSKSSNDGDEVLSAAIGNNESVQG